MPSSNCSSTNCETTELRAVEFFRPFTSVLSNVVDFSTGADDERVKPFSLQNWRKSKAKSK